MKPMWIIKTLVINFLLALSIFSSLCFAEGEKTTESSSFSSFLEYSLKNSLDRSAAGSESRYQEFSESASSKSQYIPQINLSASYQKLSYDRLRDNGSGALISNNGQNTSLGLTATYDLQKLLGADSELAKKTSYYAKLQEKILTRDVIRNIKKTFFTYLEIKAEIDELNKLISLFAKIDDILQKQKKLGINNEIEIQQFKIQSNILNSDLQSRMADLEAIYFQLSSFVSTDVAIIIEKINKITDTPQLHFVGNSNVDPEKLSKIEDQEMIENLSRDYNLSKLEYDKFNSITLPSVYVKGSRDLPTTPSSDGPLTTAEVGVSIPLDSFFTRGTQKSQLGAKSEKNQVLREKALFEYRNQIRMNVANLIRFKTQAATLDKANEETKKLLNKSFLFYSQKKLDALGTLDIFQKYLQATRNSLLNKLQLETTDAELEYLVGGVSL